METNKELTLRLEDRVLSTYEVAQRVFRQNFELPEIQFENMGRTAGRAYLNRNLIKFSPTLYAENVEIFLNRTVPHEIAHLITHKLFPFAKQAHGPEWREVCRKLGMTDVARCHSYDTSSVARLGTTFQYACACQKWNVSRTIHRRILMGQVRTCPKCGFRVNWIKPLTFAV